MEKSDDSKENVWIHQLSLSIQLDDDGSIKSLEQEEAPPTRKVIIEKYKTQQISLTGFPGIISVYGEGGLSSANKPVHGGDSEITFEWKEK